MNRVKFFQPYQYAQINAGQTGRIYYFEIPHGCVGFIQQVANLWFPNTYYKWIIDGEEVEPKLIQRQIAPVNNPKDYEPPIRVKNYIEWIATNNSTVDHEFEVLNDGYFIHIKSETLKLVE